MAARVHILGHPVRPVAGPYRRALLIGVLLVAASERGRALAIAYWTFLLVVMMFGLGGPIISSGAPKMVAELFTGSQCGPAAAPA